MLRLAPLACLLLLTACEAPVVGFWESDAKHNNGERNKLEVVSDLTGEAEIWATSCATCTDWVEFKFDFDWEDQGLEFNMDMECKDGPCVAPTSRWSVRSSRKKAPAKRKWTAKATVFGRSTPSTGSATFSRVMNPAWIARAI